MPTYCKYVVTQAESKISKAGNPMIELNMLLAIPTTDTIDNETEKTYTLGYCKDWLLPSIEWKTKQFKNSIYNASNAEEPACFLGATGRCCIEKAETPNGNTINKIKFYCEKKENQYKQNNQENKTKQNNIKEEISDDDLPF